MEGCMEGRNSERRNQRCRLPLLSLLLLPSFFSLSLFVFRFAPIFSSFSLQPPPLPPDVSEHSFTSSASFFTHYFEFSSSLLFPSHCNFSSSLVSTFYLSLRSFLLCFLVGILSHVPLLLSFTPISSSLPSIPSAEEERALRFFLLLHFSFSSSSSPLPRFTRLSLLSPRVMNQRVHLFFFFSFSTFFAPSFRGRLFDAATSPSSPPPAVVSPALHSPPFPFFYSLFLSHPSFSLLPPSLPPSLLPRFLPSCLSPFKDIFIIKDEFAY